MSSPLSLPDVTICAADTAFVEATARALRLSTQSIHFGDAILFSDVAVDGPFRCVRIPPLETVDAYSEFCLRHLANFITTRFALVIQWDGYVVNPDRWTDEFLSYDYIGAPWYSERRPSGQVGNGGFSLRSQKLLVAARAIPHRPGKNEDAEICIHFAPQLQGLGIRFAPVVLAERFSFEGRLPEKPTFGFHGRDNLWHSTSDEDLAVLLDNMDISRLKPIEVVHMIERHADAGHIATARVLYQQLLGIYSPVNLAKVLRVRRGTQAQIDVRNLESYADRFDLGRPNGSA